jgi:hypothetical protein
MKALIGLVIVGLASNGCMLFAAGIVESQKSHHEAVENCTSQYATAPDGKGAVVVHCSLEERNTLVEAGKACPLGYTLISKGNDKSMMIQCKTLGQTVDHVGGYTITSTKTDDGF